MSLENICFVNAKTAFGRAEFWDGGELFVKKVSSNTVKNCIGELCETSNSVWL